MIAKSRDEDDEGRLVRWIPPFLLWVILWATLATAAFGQSSPPLSYSVDLNDRADDRFAVTVELEGLTAENAVFQFAATAPGTYQVMDIGRYVVDFEAFDAEGNALATERISTNQWRFGAPGRVARVSYRIAETWDTPVEEHPVYMMAGTSIEDDHALVNPHAVLGFPQGMQDSPLRLRFERPAEWRMGSALVEDEDGWFHADDYDHIVDTPFLMGRLSQATMEVTGVPVEVHVYSKTDVVPADGLLDAMEKMLLSASEFLNGIPVDRYAFLFHFEDVTQGAWEHSYSSEYVYREPRAFTQQVANGLVDVPAHEFFHVITPLNIHSEIIESFNFEEPVPSEHLWLYEGVTEWASDVMQMRSELIDLDNYLRRVGQKIFVERQAGWDQEYSLSRLALTSYSQEGQAQYANIYFRGAVVAGLLDIRLLELSDGRMGLRELVLQLAERYGKDRPFPEDRFFEVVEEMTYPEIGDFFESYVQAADPLPMEEYYAKLGIRYIDSGRGMPRFEIMDDATPEQRDLRAAWMRVRPRT